MDTQQVNGNIANMHGIETAELFGNLKDVDGFDPDEVVAGCFEFRHRTRSFDLHQLTGHGSKLKFFGRLFRTPSDSGNSKQRQPAAPAAAASPGSPTASGAVTSPHQSPPHRRRLIRVVRDVNPDMYGEPNPHVVHKFSDGFMQRRRRGRTASESECGRPLPYEVTGHTILKKPSLDHSVSVNSCHSAGIGADDGTSTPPTSNKHASFRNEVVVFEFDRKCNVVESSAVTHVVQLHDAIFDDADSYAACKSFEELSIDATIAALTTESTTIPAPVDACAISATEASTAATLTVDVENQPPPVNVHLTAAAAAAAAEDVSVRIDSVAISVKNSAEPAIPSEIEAF